MRNLRPRAARIFFCLIATSAAALGCGAGGRGFHLAEDASPSGDFFRLILLPMNFDHSPTPAVAPGVELMGNHVRSHLEKMGFEVVEPRMSTTLALWQECTEGVGGIADEGGEAIGEERYEQARAELVRRTLEGYPADGAVAGAVLLRQGRYSGKSLRWDGVERRVSIDMAKTNMPVLNLNGEDLGTSLRTSVFDRRGRKIFERYVGLEPLHRYEVRYPRIHMVVRKDLFQDEALLEGAVALSFEPWLAPRTSGAE